MCSIWGFWFTCSYVKGVSWSHNKSMSVLMPEGNIPAHIGYYTVRTKHAKTKPGQTIRTLSIDVTKSTRVSCRTGVCVCVLAVRVMSGRKSRRTPCQASSCIINPQLPSRHQPPHTRVSSFYTARGRFGFLIWGNFQLSLFLYAAANSSDTCTKRNEHSHT